MFCVCGSHAPPATFLLVRLQCQMPTAVRLRVVAPQKGDWYFLCWETSIFLTIFLRDAPYRVPYFPTIPTFLVRLAISCMPNPDLLDNRNRTQKWDESPC